MNFLFLVIGLLLIAFGSWALNNLGSISSMFSTGLPIGLIILGIFVFLLSFFGFCGAAIENRYLLLMYTLIMLALMICQVAIGAAAWSQSANIDTLNSLFEKQWRRLDNETKDSLEREFQCCGFNSTTERDTVCIDTYQYSRTCAAAIEEFFRKYMHVIFYVAIVFGILEIVGLFFAMLMYCCVSLAIRQRERLLD